MEVGTKVLYNGKEYTILYVYESGNCEIQKDLYTVELVEITEIEILQ